MCGEDRARAALFGRSELMRARTAAEVLPQQDDPMTADVAFYVAIDASAAATAATYGESFVRTPGRLAGTRCRVHRHPAR